MNKSSGWKTICTIFLFCAATSIATSAQTVTILHNFDQTDDGSGPEFMSLIQGTDGNLYGITSAGAANSGGTVFKITLGGTLTTLHSFCAQAFCADGQEPLAGLVQASDGNFYGTTYYGGANANGEIFKITPAGTLTTFYSFCAISLCADGTNPHGALIQGTDGNLYGTTQQGGTHGDGTVFKITLGAMVDSPSYRIPPRVRTLRRNRGTTGEKNCTCSQSPPPKLTARRGVFHGNLPFQSPRRRRELPETNRSS